MNLRSEYKKRIIHLFSKLKRDEKGATAIEFAILALPFFGLIFLLIQSALIFWTEQVLENAVNAAGRLIRTGQAHQIGMNRAQFSNEICKHAGIVIRNCTSELRIDVSVTKTFDSFNPTPPTDEAGNIDAGKLKFNIGNSGDIVLIRVYYAWPMAFIYPGAESSYRGGNYLMTAATAFRNEPF